MIERYNPDVHFELLGSWYRARGIAESAGDPLCKPRTGFVVDNIAMGFLFRTDAPKLAYLDAWATDPNTTAEARAVALRSLLHALVNEAKRLELHVLMAFTGAPTLIDLFTSDGFTEKPGFSWLCLRTRRD